MRTIAWKNTHLINICDTDLIGKTLSEGALKMHISKEFFGGQLVDESEALQMLKESQIISLAGERCVKMALSNKLGSQQAVRLIEGVPFLMIYKF
ncbi:MAG: DUF424 domain-containing protein [Thaumarchaeota archaeon]|nr:DUF424 domain-containing protein [Nitrososphaerota archaeon]